RTGVADPRRHLQRTELHGLADGGIEVDDAAGDLVEAGEQRALVGDLLRRRLRDHLIAGLWRGVGRLRSAAQRTAAGPDRQRRLPGRPHRGGTTGRRRQRLRLHARILLPLSRIWRVRVTRVLRALVARVRVTRVALIRILRIAL